jgi:hypothetical protein
MYEVFTVVKMWILVFWIVMLCSLVGATDVWEKHIAAKDGIYMFLQNIGNHLQDNTTQKTMTHMDAVSTAISIRRYLPAKYFNNSTIFHNNTEIN